MSNIPGNHIFRLFYARVLGLLSRVTFQVSLSTFVVSGDNEIAWETMLNVTIMSKVKRTCCFVEEKKTRSFLPRASHVITRGLEVLNVTPLTMLSRNAKF